MEAPGAECYQQSCEGPRATSRVLENREGEFELKTNLIVVRPEELERITSGEINHDKTWNGKETVCGSCGEVLEGLPTFYATHVCPPQKKKVQRLGSKKRPKPVRLHQSTRKGNR